MKLWIINNKNFLFYLTLLYIMKNRMINQNYCLKYSKLFQYQNASFYYINDLSSIFILVLQTIEKICFII